MAYVNVTITSNAQSFHSERRFPASTSINDLKTKLELLTGIAANSMKLELRTSENKFVSELVDDSATISDCRIIDGSIIHVIDDSGASSRDDETGNVQKFELSDEAYDKRADSVRAWKREMQLDQHNAAVQKQKAAESQQLEVETAEAASHIKAGQRCEVRLQNQPSKRGTVTFVGKTHFKPGHWIGVKYDEPLGKNDGAVGGTRYFQCPPNYGAFVRPQDVVVGDFPEDDLGMDEI